jgi:hypothetical protein
MSVTAGALTSSELLSTSVKITSPAATGGSGPYTYQLHKSTTDGFSPGGGTVIAGATALVNTVTGLIPNTTYYFVMVVTDTGASNVTDDSAQLTVQTAVPVQSQNQFQQAPFLGMIDMRFPYNTVSVEIDVSETGTLYAGSAVKMYDSASNLKGVPKVVACSANDDEVLGFINYDIKSASFVAGSMCEISMAGNFMFLYATAAIDRGAEVTLELSTAGGVKQAASNSDTIVGWAYDGASAGGQLIRVVLKTPSFAVDA